MDSSDIVLKLSGLHAAYGQRIALDGVDVEVRRGEVLAVLGHNGAGKTTMLRVAAGLTRPQSGSIYLAGRNIDALSCSARALAGIALVPEGAAGTFPSLTVRHNLAAVKRAHRNEVVYGSDVEKLLNTAFGEVLVDRLDQTAETLSGGQRQMLAIALALIRRPSILLLDEPSTGLAPSVVQRILDVVSHFSQETGLTVVIVEQDVAAALKVASRVAIIGSGRVVADYSRKDCPPPTELWRFF